LMLCFGTAGRITTYTATTTLAVSPVQSSFLFFVMKRLPKK